VQFKFRGLLRVCFSRAYPNSCIAITIWRTQRASVSQYTQRQTGHRLAGGDFYPNIVVLGGCAGAQLAKGKGCTAPTPFAGV